MKPCRIPKVCRSTLATGARQLVVHEALEMTWCLAGSYRVSFTPKTMVMSSSLAGAEMMTLRAPASRCLPAPVRSVKRPVDSTTTSTPRSFQGRAAGSLLARTLISLPFTTRLCSLAATVPAKVPCTESCMSRWASVLALVISFTATMSSAGSPHAARKKFRPIRPKPLMPTRVAIPPSLLAAKESSTPAEIWASGFEAE